MSSPTNTGGPAAPIFIVAGSADPQELAEVFEALRSKAAGLTVRDYFAAKADVSDQMKGITVSDADRLGVPMPRDGNALDWATWRARIKARLRFIEADAMLRAREAS